MDVSKAKVGDKLVVLNDFKGDGEQLYKGEVFPVVEVNAGSDRNSLRFDLRPRHDYLHWWIPHKDIEIYMDFYSPTPSLIMTIIDSARNLFLSDDERAYRESGLKDSCGHWTAEARQLFEEQLMDAQAKDVLLPIAQKLLDKQKSDKKA